MLSNLLALLFLLKLVIFLFFETLHAVYYIVVKLVIIEKALIIWPVRFFFCKETARYLLITYFK